MSAINTTPCLEIFNSNEINVLSILDFDRVIRISQAWKMAQNNHLLSQDSFSIEGCSTTAESLTNAGVTICQLQSSFALICSFTGEFDFNFTKQASVVLYKFFAALIGNNAKLSCFSYCARKLLEILPYTEHDYEVIFGIHLYEKLTQESQIIRRSYVNYPKLAIEDWKMAMSPIFDKYKYGLFSEEEYNIIINYEKNSGDKFPRCSLTTWICREPVYREDKGKKCYFEASVIKSCLENSEFRDKDEQKLDQKAFAIDYKEIENRQKLFDQQTEKTTFFYEIFDLQEKLENHGHIDFNSYINMKSKFHEINRYCYFGKRVYEVSPIVGYQQIRKMIEEQKTKAESFNTEARIDFQKGLNYFDQHQFNYFYKTSEEMLNFLKNNNNGELCQILCTNLRELSICYDVNVEQNEHFIPERLSWHFCICNQSFTISQYRTEIDEKQIMDELLSAIFNDSRKIDYLKMNFTQLEKIDLYLSAELAKSELVLT